MNVEMLLNASSPSLLIIEKRERTDIVVGVPHHAPAGIETLQCPDEHEVSDENTGYIGRQLAKELNCCSIIACNYTMDVNKYFRSDYSTQIAKWNARVLVEIHGHGSNKGLTKDDIEISSGSCGKERSRRLAGKMSEACSKTALKNYKINGEYNTLKLPALRTITIEGARWLSYHIELPWPLRKQSPSSTAKPPKSGYQFCRILAGVLSELHSQKTR